MAMPLVRMCRVYSRRQFSVTFARMVTQASSDAGSVIEVDGGYYSAAAIERRLSRKRSRGPDGLGRTTPPPSEEDAYAAAGAPGYTEDDLAALRQGNRESSPAPISPAPYASRPVEDGAPWQPLPAARVARAFVHVRDLSAFIRTYELLMLPAYARAPGFSQAHLLVRGLPPGATRAGIVATSLASPRGSTVEVASWVVFTGPDAASALAAAQASETYMRATSALTNLAARQLLRSNAGVNEGPTADNNDDVWAVVAHSGPSMAPPVDVTGVHGAARYSNDDEAAAVGSTLGLR